MHPSRVLTYILAGMIGGIFLRSFVDIGLWEILFGVILAIAIIVLAFLFHKNNSMIAVGIVVFAGCVGIARFTLMSTDVHVLDVYVGEEMTTEAVVISEPDVRENYTRLILEVQEEDNAHPEQERILAYVERYPEYHYGDRVAFTGELAYPEAFASDDTGRTFDYPAYLRKDGIRYQAFRPDITYMSSGNGNIVRSAVLSLKETFLNGLERALPEPESSLAGGLIVGAKQSLGAKLLEEFRAAGVMHLVVLSGYNITIVAEAFMCTVSFLPAVWGSLFGVGGILLFTLMTGAGATVVRASFMALLVIFARRIGRPYAMERALFLAGGFMIFHNPYILVFDPSFQLSFLATLALIFVVPIMTQYISFVPERFGMREIVSATIATQIFVLPFILYMMGDLSLVAVPVNLLILSVVPATMLFGFIGGMVGIINPMLGIVTGMPAYLLLAYILGIVRVFAGLPMSVIHIPAFPFWVITLVYVCYGYIIYIFRQKQEEQKTIDQYLQMR